MSNIEHLKKILNDRYTLVEKKLNKDITSLKKLLPKDQDQITNLYESGETWATMSYRSAIDTIDIEYHTHLVSDFFKQTDRFDNVEYPMTYANDVAEDIHEAIANSKDQSLINVKPNKILLLYNLREIGSDKHVVIVTNRGNVHKLTPKQAIIRLKKFKTVIKNFNPKANQTLDKLATSNTAEA